MKFPIGHLAWARVRDNKISLDNTVKFYRPFLVIGAVHDIRALLIPPNIEDNGLFIKVTSDLIELYKIPFKYDNKKIIQINICYLTYLGGICYECQLKFDYLSELDTFKCWKCSL